MSQLRINCHTHVFNFGSVFTDRSLEILLGRLKLHPRATDAVIALIKPILKRIISKAGKGLEDPEDVINEILDKLNVSDLTEDLASTIGNLLGTKIKLRSGSVFEQLGKKAFGNFFDALWEQLVFKQTWSGDASSADLRDILNFLFIGLQPNISEVTDILMAGKSEDEAVVALMMDITSQAGQEEDENQFVDQMMQTSQQIQNYPGRFFPFVAMHPERDTCVDHVKDALRDFGFVGLKLYPGLGYPLDQTRIRDALEACAEAQAPAMVHCNKGGFTAQGQSYRSDPKDWIPILEDIQSLKMCFGHFGGDNNFLNGPEEDNFTNTVLQLMERFPGRVFADVSYHDAPMLNKEDKKTYFTRLKSWLEHPVRGKQILFGTDFHLVCMRVTEPHFRQFFADNLTVKQMNKMEVANAARFLGLPTSENPMTENIKRYCAYVKNKRLQCARPAAPWLAKALTGLYGEQEGKIVPIGDKSWTVYNKEHFRTALWMKENQMYPSQKHKLGKDFDGIGRVMVNQLRYWNYNFAAPQIASEKSSKVARQLHQHLKKNDWKCSDDTKAIDALGKALAQGDTRISDVGRLVHQYYRR